MLMLALAFALVLILVLGRCLSIAPCSIAFLALSQIATLALVVALALTMTLHVRSPHLDHHPDAHRGCSDPVYLPRPHLHCDDVPWLSVCGGVVEHRPGIDILQWCR